MTMHKNKVLAKFLLFPLIFCLLLVPPFPNFIIAAKASSGATAAVPFSEGAVVNVVDAIGLTVSDLDRSVEFFTKVLFFEKVSDVEVFGKAYEHLQGIFGL